MTEKDRGEPFLKNALDILLEEKFLPRSIPYLDWSASHSPDAKIIWPKKPQRLKFINEAETSVLLDKTELVRSWLEANGQSIYEGIERADNHDDTLEFTNNTYRVSGDFHPSVAARIFAWHTTSLSIHKIQGNHIFGFNFKTDKSFWLFIEYNHRKRLASRTRYESGKHPLLQMDQEQHELANAVLDDFMEKEMGIVTNSEAPSP